MAQTESRYNAITNLGEKKEYLIGKRNELKIAVKTAENDLKLSEKNLEIDKKNVKDKALTEQKDLAEQNDKEYKFAKVRCAKEYESRLKDCEETIKSQQERIEKDKQEKIEKLADIESTYVKRKEQVDNWVKNSDLRIVELDRKIERDKLTVGNLKDTLSIKIETIEEQIANIDKTMEILSKVSIQAPPSTKESQSEKKD